MKKLAKCIALTAAAATVISSAAMATLFQVNGPVGLKNWVDYCYDLSGSAIEEKLTSDAFELKTEDGAVAGIAYVIESYGIIANKTLLEKAGYTNKHYLKRLY